MLHTVRQLLSLIRFSHTLFALPFALLAALMAWRLQGGHDEFAVFTDAATGDPILIYDSYVSVAGLQFDTTGAAQLAAGIRWQELVGVILCMVFARSAAMAFNRLVDRRVDAENPRTAGRHLPAGTLSVAQVAMFAAGSAAAFVASTLWFLPNQLPLYLSLPVLLWLCGYSYAKRFTSLAQFWLGAALGMSPVAAWIAIRGEAVIASPIDLLPAVVLGGAVLTWVAGFDMIYACQDYEFDRQAGLYSIPARLGIAGSLRLAAACHAVTVLLLGVLPLVYPPLGWLWGVGVACVAALLLYEHWLVKPDDLDRVNVAFFNVNAVISVGVLVVGTVDLLVDW